MNKKKLFVIVALVFVLFLGGAYSLYTHFAEEIAPQQPQTQSAQNENSNAEDKGDDKILAPDFTVYDADGNEVHLSDYIGKPIVLNFWASWCAPCKMGMPDFQKKYVELGDEIQFVMVNMTVGRETMESAAEFIDEQGYTFPVLYDIDSDAANAFGAYSLPRTYFIDSEGYAIAQATGTISGETLQYGIEMIS